MDEAAGGMPSSAPPVLIPPAAVYASLAHSSRAANIASSSSTNSRVAGVGIAGTKSKRATSSSSGAAAASSSASKARKSSAAAAAAAAAGDSDGTSLPGFALDLSSVTRKCSVTVGAAQLTLLNLAKDVDTIENHTLDAAMLDSTWTKELDDALREGVLREGESLAAWPRVAQHIATALELQHACSATEAYQRWAMIRDAPIKGPCCPISNPVIRGGCELSEHICIGTFYPGANSAVTMILLLVDACSTEIRLTPSTAEDDMLRGLVEEHGSKKWSQIAMGLPGRSGKQCRERWLNHLDTRVTK
eukprot:1297-Heterococcus_DN1.PRE.1